MDNGRILPFFVGTLALVTPANVAAQAWLPGEGRTTFSITYQWLDASDHIFSRAVEGSELTPFEQWSGIDLASKNSTDFGVVQSMGVILDADVGITDRLAVFGGLAFLAPRYIGTFGYPTVPGDDGNFHGTFQDARIGARYAAVNDGSWRLTPFAAFLFPTHDYPVYGHSAPGLGLKELQTGASVGRFLNVGSSPGLWLQGAYWYSFMENVSDEITLDRSNLMLELGYFVNKRLSANFLATWQKVHGGLEAAEVSHPTLSLLEVLEQPHLYPAFHAHDRAIATREWRFGGGASFQVSDTVELVASINSLLWGENTHDAFTVNFGVNFGFQFWGSSGLGMWEDHEDPNSDLDDWLLEDLEGDAGGKGTEKKQEGSSSW